MRYKVMKKSELYTNATNEVSRLVNEVKSLSAITKSATNFIDLVNKVISKAGIKDRDVTRVVKDATTSVKLGGNRLNTAIKKISNADDINSKSVFDGVMSIGGASKHFESIVQNLRGIEDISGVSNADSKLLQKAFTDYKRAFATFEDSLSKVMRMAGMM